MALVMSVSISRGTPGSEIITLIPGCASSPGREPCLNPGNKRGGSPHRVFNDNGVFRDVCLAFLVFGGLSPILGNPIGDLFPQFRVKFERFSCSLRNSLAGRIINCWSETTCGDNDIRPFQRACERSRKFGVHCRRSSAPGINLSPDCAGSGQERGCLCRQSRRAGVRYRSRLFQQWACLQGLYNRAGSCHLC